MDPITLSLLIGGGTSLLKHFAVDKPKENRDRELAAKTQELSPWTGLKANPIEEHNVFGDVLPGVVAGAQFGVGLQQAKQAEEMNKIYGDWMKSQTWRGRDIMPMASNGGFNYQPNSGWSLLK